MARLALLGMVRVKPIQGRENLQNLVRLKREEGDKGVKNSIPVTKSNMVLQVDMGKWTSNLVYVGIAWEALKNTGNCFSPPRDS